MKGAARKGDEERRQEKDAVPEQAGIRTAEQEDAVKQDKELKIGKLDDTVYDSAIRKRLATVWAHAEAEEISRSLPLEGDDLNYVLRSVSRISFSAARGLAGRLALLHAVDTLAAKGAYPRLAGVSIMLPMGTMESELRALVDQLCDTAEEEEVQIAQVRTEITRAVNTPLVETVCLGDPTDEKHEKISAEDIPGFHLILTRWIGLEGTAVLGIRRREELLERFPALFVETAAEAIHHLSVRKDARLINAFSDRCAMVALGEGGLYAALWYMANLWQCGLTVNWERVPIRQETVEICNFYDLDPCCMWSTGSLLAAVPEDGVAEVLAALRRQDIPASDIGVLTRGRDRVIRHDGEERFLDRPQPDALLRFEDL